MRPESRGAATDNKEPSFFRWFITDVAYKWFVMEVLYKTPPALYHYALYRTRLVAQDTSGPIHKVRVKAAALETYSYRPERTILERADVNNVQPGAVCALFYDRGWGRPLSTRADPPLVWLRCAISRSQTGYALTVLCSTRWRSPTGAQVSYTTQHASYPTALAALHEWLTTGCYEDFAELDLMPFDFPYMRQP